jgi:hypothetical protein
MISAGTMMGADAADDEDVTDGTGDRRDRFATFAVLDATSGSPMSSHEKAEADEDAGGSGSDDDDGAAAREGEAHRADDALRMAQDGPSGISMREFDDGACCG